jgi:hypothetical protein
MIDDDDCGAMIGRETEVLRENLLQLLLCPPQVSHDLGRHGGKPETNRLSYVMFQILYVNFRVNCLHESRVS